MRHKSMVLVVSLFSVLWAKSITVQVVQRAPLDGQSGLDPCEETYVIEDAVMDAMFDEGHIVTNFSSICQPLGKSAVDRKDALRAIDNALMGGSRYFVMFFVKYKDNVKELTSPEAVLMENIEGMEWQSYDTRTRQMIGEGSEKATVPQKDCRESVTQWASAVAKKVLSN